MSGDPGPPLLPPLPGATDRTTLPLRRLACLVAVAAAVLGAGVAVAVSDPVDWEGSSPRDLSQSPDERAGRPVIAADATGATERMVVVWSDQRPTSSDVQNVYYLLSSDSGSSWSAAPEAVTQTAQASYRPTALVVGERAFVAWYEFQAGDPPTITIREAEIGTGTVHPIPCPPGDSPSQVDARVSLAAVGDTLHVMFNAAKNLPSHLFHAARLLTETVWPTASRVYTSTSWSIGASNPALAVGPGPTLHVAWEERVGPYEYEIRYMSGTVNGVAVNWDASSLITLSTGITLSVWPHVAADSGGGVHVVWGEVVGKGLPAPQLDQYVRYAHYDPGGGWGSQERIYSDPMKVSQKYPNDVAPSVALLEGSGQVTVCVTWHGYISGTSMTEEEVLIGCSDDGGGSWSAPQNVSRSPELVPEDTDLSLFPFMTADTLGELHVVWEEHNGSTTAEPKAQVYYARSGVQKVFLPLILRTY